MDWGLVALAVTVLVVLAGLFTAVSADAEPYSESIETDDWGYDPETCTLWMTAGAVPDIGGATVTDLFLFGEGDFGFVRSSDGLKATVEYVEFYEGTATVTDGILAGYTALEWLVFSDDVEHIGTGIVEGCTSLQSIVFGDGLVSVDDRAFDGLHFARLSDLVPFAHHPDVFRGRTFSTVAWGDQGHLYLNDVDRVKGVGWTVSDGTLTITSFGADRYGFVNEDGTVVTDAPWGQYRYGIDRIVVGPGVDTVPGYAFFGMHFVRQVDLGDVKYIRNAAFANCVALEDVDLSRVLGIESYAFYQCCSLRADVLTLGLSIIPSHSFYGCTSLEEVVLIQAATIGQHAFSDRSGGSVITQITFGNSLSFLSPSAFGRTTFILSDGTEADRPSDLAGRTFCHVDGNVYREAQACGEETYWHIREGTLYISGYGPTVDFQATKTPWYSVRKTIETVVVTEGVTYVGDKAFYKYPNLREIYLPDSVTGLGDYAFRGDFGHVVVGTGLVSCGIRSICNDDGFVDITGKTVKPTAKTLVGRVFDSPDLGPLKAVSVSGSTGSARWTFQADGTLTVDGSGAVVFGKASEYPWYKYRAQITEVFIDGVTTVGAYAFKGCPVTAVHLWEGRLIDGTLTVGDHAFGDTVTDVWFGSPVWKIWSGQDCFGKAVTPLFKEVWSSMAPVTHVGL